MAVCPPVTLSHLGTEAWIVNGRSPTVLGSQLHTVAIFEEMTASASTVSSLGLSFEFSGFIATLFLIEFLKYYRYDRKIKALVFYSVT